MNFELFLGRFHPLVVHLPIGFLLLAAIMEGLSRLFKEKFSGLDLAISISILCGGFGAVGSAVIGYLLASGGGYDEQTLFWHKWLGIGLGILAFFGWAVKAGYVKMPRQSASIVIGLLVLLVSVTGHLGGNLTHGSDYLLTYAPKFVKQLAGSGAENAGGADIPLHPDSVVVFEHLVQPALVKKCGSCHGETKSQGGLMVTSQEGLEKGGDDGPAVVAGKAHESELFVRVTLPQSSKKFMPPKGDPLTYSELKILEWWVASGASYHATLTENEVPAEIKSLLLRDYGVDTKPKPYYEMVQVPMLGNAEIQKLTEAGLMVEPLSSGHHFLQVKSGVKSVTKDQIDQLLVASEQVTWLDLGDKMVGDEMLTSVGKLVNLTKLKLNNNPITDNGLSKLKDLKHLEMLNLYGTDISDESIQTFKQMPALRSLYLWQSKMTAEGIENLRKALPRVKIIVGFENTAIS